MEKNSLIYIAGVETFVGQALLQVLRAQGYANVLPEPGGDPDLTDSGAVDAFFSAVRPRYVFVAGGPSGGIGANQKYPADLMHENLRIVSNVIPSAWRHGVQNLLFLASSCVYPRDCPQPMRVESLGTASLEPTSQAYAMANLAGVQLCQAYRAQYGTRFIPAVKADAFGIDDEFNPEDSHVVPALIKRMHEVKVAGASEIVLWGTGTPRREFIFADDLADACVFVMRYYNGREPINLGGGSVLSIRELADMIREIVGFRGELRFDTSKPDGAPMKIFDSAPLLAMGWRPKTLFRDALGQMYAELLKRRAGGRPEASAPPMRSQSVITP